MTELAGKINVNAVVIGDFHQDQKEYTVHLSAVRISDGAVLYTTDIRFRHDEYLDSLAKPFPPPGIIEPVRMQAPSAPTEKWKGRPPICQRCLTPVYTVAARGAKLQGTVAFDAIIDADGTIAALRPTKVLGLGLDEAAYDVITKQWRMTPGTTLEGKPVVTVVPIEVTFRLY
jgi:Gram-negative bacterial TonB protein C-terminal